MSKTLHRGEDGRQTLIQGKIIELQSPRSWGQRNKGQRDQGGEQERKRQGFLGSEMQMRPGAFSLVGLRGGVARSGFHTKVLIAGLGIHEGFLGQKLGNQSEDC